MGVKLEFLNDDHGVMATASGKLTGEALVAAVRRINEFAVKTKPLCYTFFENAGLRQISVTTGDLAKAAECAMEAANATETERIVAIYADDEFTYRLALIYKVFIEQTGWEVWAFRDRPEALAWLRSRAGTKHGLAVAIP